MTRASSWRLSLWLMLGLLCSCISDSTPESLSPTEDPREHLAEIWAGRKDGALTQRHLDGLPPSSPPGTLALAQVYRAAGILHFGAPGDGTEARAQLIHLASDLGELPCVAARAAHYRAYNAPDDGIDGAALLTLLDQALTRFPACGDAPLEAKLYLKRADVLRDLSRPADAYLDYEAARRRVQDDPPTRLTVDFRLATLSHDLGDVPGTRRRYEALLREARDLKTSRYVAAITSALGNLEADEGAWETAEALLTEARDLYGATHAPVDEALQNLTLARVALDRGEVGDVDLASQRIGASAPLGEDALPRHHHYRAWLEARLAFAQGAPVQAQAALERLLGLELVTEQRWRALLTLADVHKALGHRGAEREVLWTAVDLVEAQRRETALLLTDLAYRSQRSGLYVRWLESLVLAWEAGGRLEGQDRPVDVPPSERFPRGPVNADTLLAAADRIATDDWAMALWQDRGDLARRLSRQLPRLSPGAWPSGQTLRAELEAGEVVILLVPLSRQILGIRVERKQTRALLLPQPSEALARTAMELRDALATPGLSQARAGESLGASLLGALLTPPPPQDSPLGFIPMGSLSALPFPALKVDGRYLVERYLPFELPSLGSLRWLPEGPAALNSGSLAILYGQALDHAPAEIAALRASGLPVQVLTGAEATVSGVRERLAGSGLLHFAVHASPPGGEAPRGLLHLHDGDLDLADGPALGGSLVVLAACGGHVGGSELLEPGYGAIHRSALLAGGRGAVAARWDVDDQATSRLMTAFYQNRPLEGPARALALAQRELISSADALDRVATRRPRIVDAETGPVPLSDPFAWAAFALVGRWR